jgi:hypothetical protein
VEAKSQGVTAGFDGIGHILPVTQVTAVCAVDLFRLVLMTPGFSILSNRKRAIVALVHSIAFLALASRDLAVHAQLGGILAQVHASTGNWVLLVIYTIVSSILIYLLAISAGLHERLYFAFCAASASTGVVRALIGDAAFPAGLYLRICMLLAAVCTGIVLLRIHTGVAASPIPELAD